MVSARVSLGFWIGESVAGSSWKVLWRPEVLCRTSRKAWRLTCMSIVCESESLNRVFRSPIMILHLLFAYARLSHMCGFQARIPWLKYPLNNFLVLYGKKKF